MSQVPVWVQENFEQLKELGMRHDPSCKLRVAFFTGDDSMACDCDGKPFQGKPPEQTLDDVREALGLPRGDDLDALLELDY